VSGEGECASGFDLSANTVDASTDKGYDNAALI